MIMLNQTTIYRADGYYKTKKSSSVFPTAPADSYRLIQELQIEKIALNTQNQHLIQMNHGDYREVVRDILQALNEPDDFYQSITHVLEIIKKGIGFDAVGIRLFDGEDYPYYASTGFSEGFLCSENSLRDQIHGVSGICAAPYQMKLECTCGVVLSGRTDSTNGLFTPGGSFWTGNSFSLLELPVEKDPRYHPRNICIQQGYASVALIPIRDKENIVGLLQLNDRALGKVSSEFVGYLEEVATHIGSALFRKSLEESLRKSEEKYRLLFENACESILIIEKSGKIAAANPVACERLGYTLNELTSMTIMEVDTLEDSVKAEERISTILRDGQATFEAVHQHRNGTPIHVEVSSRLINLDGKGVMLSICRDITGRKLAEKNQISYQQQLRSLADDLCQAEEMERRRIATELHDQLGQTLAFAKMKLATLVDEQSSDARMMSMSQLENALENSIQEVRSLSFQLSPPLLYELGLEAAVEELGECFQQEHGFTVEFSDDDSYKPLDKPLQIAIYQVIRELLVNIAKHADCNVTQIRLNRSGNRYLISVCDDGCGFDISEARTKRGSGGGFGLFNIRQRVGHFGGEFSIHSEAGKGTTAVISLPLEAGGFQEKGGSNGYSHPAG